MNTISTPLALEGVHTAIVTPFTRSGSRIDYPMLRELVESQVTGGVRGIVPVGTTGESPTLSEDEHINVIAETVKQVNGRVLVIGGIGSNSTREAIHYAQENERVGADAGLSVVPYYNKPNQEGLYQHFRAQAESTSLPIVLYSIPGRCGANIQLEIPTIIRLAHDCPNIVGLKEAGGDLQRFIDIRKALNDTDLSSFQILSGDDGLTLPTIEAGSTNGVISVASNILPSEMSEIVRLANAGSLSQAGSLAHKYNDLFRALFMPSEPNPQATKYILSRMRQFQGRFQNVLRSPLIPVGEVSQKELNKVIGQYNL